MALIAGGCVRSDSDDLSACEYPLRLHFSYLYNRESRDLLHEEVPAISLCLFDSETGRFVKGAEISVSELDANGNFIWLVPSGRFSLVSWGGAGDRYRIADNSSLSAHKLMLPLAEKGQVSHSPQHLWHNLTTDILINGDITPVYNIDLHKLSNDVTVTVSSTNDYPLESGKLLGVRSDFPDMNGISVTHNLYNYLGQIDSSSAKVFYLPSSDLGSPKRHIHRYTTLGLSRYDDSHLNVGYGDKTIYDGSLTELIARQPDIIFDLDDDFRLDFNITPGPDGNASVAVSVNDWHIHDYTVSLK